MRVFSFVALKLADTTYRHISNLPQPRGWEKKIAEGPPCVVLASPGFMQSGPSRELLELWAPDSRNGLIITGYSIEGTMARVSDIGDYYLHTACILCEKMQHLYPFSPSGLHCRIDHKLIVPSPYHPQDIMVEPEEIESMKGGGMIPRKISVEYISFSAHVDYSQNSEFIELVKAQHVVSHFKACQ